jgi:hypothetical protein
MSINRPARPNRIPVITGNLRVANSVQTPGGTKTTNPDSIIYSFNGSGELIVGGLVNTYNNNSKVIKTSVSSGVNAQILVVGGGGGTQENISAAPKGYGGGGGAGGVAYMSSASPISTGTYTVTIGAGGNSSPRPSPNPYPRPGIDGNNSSFVGSTSTPYNIVARAGGGGAQGGGNPGGSGGGASYTGNPVGEGTQPAQSQTAPSPVTNYGNHGGPSFPYGPPWPASSHASSGGGGAGANGTFIPENNSGHPGGVGILIPWATSYGESGHFGGGGGGCGNSPGNGGNGGGGNARQNPGSYAGEDGDANTGGGAGGGLHLGGSGVVIIRQPT